MMDLADPWRSSQDVTTNPKLSAPLRDLLDGKSAEERKTYPLYSGVIAYFRDALYRVAHHSWVGNEQHHPGQPLHWARGKSFDQLDCVARHLAEAESFTTATEEDAVEYALAAMTWRSLAALQSYLERRYQITPPPNARSND